MLPPGNVPAWPEFEATPWAQVPADEAMVSGREGARAIGPGAGLGSGAGCACAQTAMIEMIETKPAPTTNDVFTIKSSKCKVRRAGGAFDLRRGKIAAPRRF